MNARRTGILILGIVATAAACSRNRPPADRGAVVTSDRTASVVSDNDDSNRSTAARFNVPPGHLPPPGQCRVWIPGEPPGQQKKKYPVGQCSALRLSVPPGGWLIYRPTDDRKEVLVWEYGAERQVLAERIYSAVTGELLKLTVPKS